MARIMDIRGICIASVVLQTVIFGSGSAFTKLAYESISPLWALAIRIEPIGFLVVKDGVVRMLNIQPPAMTTLDRVIDLVPQLLDRAEAFIDKKNAPAPTETVAE